MKRIMGVMALALAFLLGASVEKTAEIPRPPLRIIVPFAPGTSSDLMTRLISEELHASLRRPVQVENQSGASGRVGVGSLARTPADGNVIGVGNETTHVTMPLLKGRTAYDPVHDFTPLSLAVRTTIAVAVNPALLRVRTVPELVAAAQKRPIEFGTPGSGSPQHLIGLLISQRSGVHLRHVPQPGAAATARELAEGRLPLAITTLSSLLPYRDKVQIIAIGDPGRQASFPEVPTLSETWPDVVVTGWVAYFAPAGLPKPVAAALTAALQAALRKPAVLAALREQALDPVGSSAEELGTLVQSSLDAWAPQMRSVAAEN
jgi:tripartite-type tricarboxylate transporter receptor subunit TctC